MTPEQITIVKSTITRAHADLPVLVTDFYTRLFAAAPELREFFATDLADQRRKFAAQLEAIGGALDDFDAFVAHVAELGQRHQTYGVRPDHYAVAGPPLLATLAAALGDDWTGEVEQAWRCAYNLIAETMMASAVPAANG